MNALGQACLFAALVLWVEHWFPWRLMLRRDLPRLAAYILGVLALAGALTWLFDQWRVAGAPGEWAYVAGLWAVILSGGAAVLVAHGLDWVLGRLVLSWELEELVRANGRKSGEMDEGQHG